MNKKWFFILMIGVSLFAFPLFAQDRGKKVVPEAEKSAQSQPYAEGTLIKAKGASETFVIKNGKKCYIPDPATFESRRYQWDKVVEVEVAVLNKIPTGNPLPSVKYYNKATFPDGTLLRAKGTTPIYVIEKGKKRWIPNVETFEAKGFRFAAIKEIEPDHLGKIPLGDPLILPKPIVRSPSDVKEGMLIRAKGTVAVYVVKNGKKSWIPNPQTFEALGYKWNRIMDLEKNILDKIPLGSPLPSLKPGRP
jgi:hypothetical protein